MRFSIISAFLIFGALLVPPPASASHVDCEEVGESDDEPDNRIEFRANPPTLYVCVEQFCADVEFFSLICLSDTEAGDDPGERVSCNGEVEVKDVSTDPPRATICVDQQCATRISNGGEELRPKCYAGDEITI